MKTQDLTVACHAVLQGKVLAYPTEAVYALGCLPECEEATRLICKMKNRLADKGFILIASELRELESYFAQVKPRQMMRATKRWPGPYTWVFPASSTCPAWVKGRGGHSVAMRITTHPMVRKLCSMIGSPLISTSANISREPALCRSEEVEEVFSAYDITILQGETQKLVNPTTIRDVVTNVVYRS